MLPARLRQASRAPSATAVGTGFLRSHEMRFHKRGRDGSGKCNAQATDDARCVVHGVVYRIAAHEFGRLDVQEDVPDGGYTRRQVAIEMTDRSEQRIVHCYFANDSHIDDKLRPFGWYRSLVIAGALEHDLPGEYVQTLRESPCVDDHDPVRRRQGLDLLASD